MRRHFIKALVTGGKKWFLLLLAFNKEADDCIRKDHNDRGIPVEKPSICISIIKNNNVVYFGVMFNVVFAKSISTK